MNVTNPNINYAILRNVVFGTSAVTAHNSINLGGNNMNGGLISPPASGGGIIGGGL